MARFSSAVPTHRGQNLQRTFSGSLRCSVGSPSSFDVFVFQKAKEILTESNIPHGNCVICLYGFKVISLDLPQARFWLLLLQSGSCLVFSGGRGVHQDQLLPLLPLPLPRPLRQPRRAGAAPAGEGAGRGQDPGQNPAAGQNRAGVHTNVNREGCVA